MESEQVEGADASSVEADSGTEDLGSETTVGVGSEVSESDSPTYTVKVGGEEIEVTLEEALNGYMRQSDYTAKTQAVAQQREEIGYADRLVQALQSDPQQAVSALIQAYGLENVLASGVVDDLDDIDESQLDPIEQRLLTQERWIEEQEARQFESQVQSELSALHEQYGNFDEAALIDFMLERQIPDFQDAMTVFVSRATTAAAQRKQAEALKAKQNMSPVAGGTHVSGNAVVSGGTEPIRSVRAAFEAAMAEHGR